MDDGRDVRVRRRGDAVVCPVCGGDMFVYATTVERDRTRPAFCARVRARTRYYRCGDPQCPGRDARTVQCGE
jgi:hypothetical protein